MKNIVFVSQNAINRWIFERVCYSLNAQIKIRFFDNSKDALQNTITDVPDFLLIEEDAFPYSALHVLNQLAQARNNVSVIVMSLDVDLPVKSFYHEFKNVVDVVEFPVNIHWISRYVSANLAAAEVK
jgi:hypothetical protein